MSMDKAVKMNDGTLGWLTTSGRYYIRRYRVTPRLGLERPVKSATDRNWTHVAYYGLDKIRVQLARARCSHCNARMFSKMCGDFQMCKCRKSFIDTDRWFPERHRYGGKALPF